MTVSETIRQLICLAYDRNADADITFGEALRFYGAMCAAETLMKQGSGEEEEEAEEEEAEEDIASAAFGCCAPAGVAEAEAENEVVAVSDDDSAPTDEEAASEDSVPDSSLTMEKMAAAILNAPGDGNTPRHYVEFKRETYARLRAYRDKERINAWPLIIDQDNYFDPKMLRSMYNGNKFPINTWRRLAEVLDRLCPVEAATEGGEEA